MLAPGSGDLAAGMAVGGAGVLPSGLYSLPFFAAGPRFGISWDPLRRGRTVLRAGGGAFFDRISLSPALNALTNAPLVYTRLVYYGDLDRLAETVARQVIVPAASMTSLLGNNRMPTVYNFSFGIQQQIARGLIIDIFYVGSLSRHLLWQRNINAVPPGANHLDLHPENGDRTTPSRPLPWNFLRPYRGYGDINLIEFASTANYNSLQLGVNRRMARGIQATASYAMGKVLGSAAAEGTAVSPFFSPRTRNYGPLPSDKKHVVSLRYTWSPPKLGKRLRWRLLAMAADGWELAGMGQFATGTPFLPGFGTVDGQDVTGTPSESARVSVGDPLAGPERRFVRGPRGGFGNAGTGILRTNGINNWDVSANRMFRLAKGWLLRFRVETYNTLNHTQFAALSPNTRFDAQGNQLDAMFLQPISARSPRRLQFTIRLAW